VKKLRFEWDGPTDTVTIEGIKYAAQLFRDLGGILPVGRMFTVVERQDGVLTIQQLDSIAAAVDAGVAARMAARRFPDDPEGRN
jgi:hypothetical protein